MRACSRIGWRGLIQQEIRENGLAVLAVHNDPFQFFCADASSKCFARLKGPKMGLNESLQLLAQRLVGAKEKRFSGGLAQFEDIADLFVVHPLVLVHENG